MIAYISQEQGTLKFKFNIFILNINFKVPCRTSPRCCSRGSPGGWIRLYF